MRNMSSVCASAHFAGERGSSMTKEKILRRTAALLTVKSIVTITLTAVFAALALRGDVTGQDFLTIFLMVISFYFGTQSKKTQEATENAQ